MVLSDGERGSIRVPRRTPMERQRSILLNACTRCSGDLVLREDDGDTTGTCLQCGNVVYMTRGVPAPATATQGAPAAA